MNYTIKSISTDQELDSTLSFMQGIFGDMLSWESAGYSRKKWLNRIKTHGNLMLYAVSDNKVISVVFGRITSSGYMTIGPVGTDKNFRNNGITSKLMAEIEKRAADQEITGVALGAVEGTENFYLRLGYIGSLLVQSEKHSVDELLSFSNKYPVKYTNIHDDTINQVCFTLDNPDRELQRAYEQDLGDCWTQMVFGKKLLPESIHIPGYGDVGVLGEYLDLIKSSKDTALCNTSCKAREVLNFLAEDKTVLLTGDYLRSYYIMNYIQHYENELGRDAGLRRTRMSRLCYIARQNQLVDIEGAPDIPVAQWIGDKIRDKLYLLPVRRFQRIMTDIRRAEEGIGFDFLDSKIYIKPFVYVPSDSSVPAMYVKYTDAFLNKSVADMGTGTGILALLAAQSGAKQVEAVDINPFAVECAKTNAVLSGYGDIINVVENDLFGNLTQQYDVILFNTPWVQGTPKNMYELAIYDNRFSVLKRFMATVNSYLNKDGIILLQLSDISQQSDKSIDLLQDLIEQNGFINSNSFYIQRKNRMYGRLEKVYLFEIRRMSDE